MAGKFDIQAEYDALLRLHQKNRRDKALQIYQRVLKLHPANPFALDLFGMTANRFRLHDMAVQLLSAAVALQQGNAAFCAHLGLALRDSGDLHAAAHWYEQALELNPDSAEVLHNLGDLFLEQGQLDNAITLYCHSLERDPTSLDSYNNLGEALLKNGDLNEALRMFDHCLEQQPGRVRALSLKCIALGEAGRQKELDTLLDFNKLVFVKPAEPQPPYIQLQEFNRQLANYISKHHALSADLSQISTRNGKQTLGNLFVDDHPLIETLKAMINSRISDYQLHMRQFPEHPHALAAPAKWRLEGWGVRLEDQGYQAAHVHYDGWSSCVYYIELPEVISGKDKQGWIRFGPGQQEMYRNSRPPVHDVQPQEGYLVMFPSWIWHQTMPFTSTQPRICIAADIIPA